MTFVQQTTDAGTIWFQREDAEVSVIPVGDAWCGCRTIPRRNGRESHVEISKPFARAIDAVFWADERNCRKLYENGA